MAIRIDLLPGYVGLRRWFKRILAACLFAVVAFAAILFLLYYNEQLRLQTLLANRNNIESFAKQAEAAEAAAAAAEGQAKPMQDAVNFFVDAGRTGAERAALLDLLHRYVYAGSVVGAIDLSDGQTAKMTAMVRTPDDYARFLLNLRRGTVPTGVLFSELPSGSGIMGWPNKSGRAGGQGAGAAAGAPAVPGGQVGGAAAGTAITYQVFPNSITASAKLREPIVIPSPPGEAAAGGAGAPGAAPGDPGAPPPDAAPVEPPPA